MAYLRIAQIAERIGDIHPSHAWRMLRNDPEAPKPIKLGARLTVFDEAEVTRWIEGKVAAARQAPAQRKAPSAEAIRRGAETRKARRTQSAVAA
ncbi:MAG: AlpA family phage regulatory protein [Rhodocyclaceae bacterium]|nr:AlpA family phage regulatory protein [Rhodocyclaceae bacterium]